MTGEVPRDYPDRPFVGVGIVCFKGDRVLLARRGKAPVRHAWSIPGGAQELDETVRETALRELAEETGVEAELIGLIDVVDSITRDDDGRVQFHYTLVDFAAEWRAGEARAGSDVAGVQWTKLDEIDGLGLWEETVRIIRAGQSLRNGGGAGN